MIIFGINRYIAKVNKLSLMLLSDYIAACRIAALMVIFVQLHKHRLPQREDQAVSSIKLMY